MLIQSNLSQVLAQLKDAINVQLQQKVLKDIAKKIYDSSTKRVFYQGLAVDGSRIGKYSSYTKMLRRKKGLETSFVNMTYTGHLKSVYRMKKADEIYLILFTEDSGKEEATKAEKYFSKKIFGLTKDDEAMAKKAITEFVKKTNAKK